MGQPFRLCLDDRDIAGECSHQVACVGHLVLHRALELFSQSSLAEQCWIGKRLPVHEYVEQHTAKSTAWG